MDFLKKAASDYISQSESSQQGQQQQQPQQGSSEGSQQQQAQSQGQDYGDKALDFVAKKAGYNLSPETEEMITDAAREGYEKYSGKQVDPKYSN